MKKRGGKNTKPKLYSHIASAIIPSVGIIAVPSAAYHFPRQKVRGSEEWGPLASTLLRASSTSQLLVPSSTMMTSQEELQYISSIQGRVQGRIDTTTDEEESDDARDQQPKRRELTQISAAQSNKSRSTSLSDAEKRLFGYKVNHNESISTEASTENNSVAYLDPKQALTAELSRSIDEKNVKRTSVSITHQNNSSPVFNPVPSQAGPTSARSGTGAEGIGGELKSVTTIPRSSLNDTSLPASARSVSFKEPIAAENEYSPSSKSSRTTTVLAYNPNSALNDIIIPPPEEYQQNLHELEKRNLLLNDEVQQLRLNNRNLQKQQEELLDRLQTSQKIPQQELTDLLRQSGRDQTKDLENLTTTLQNRCDQLQNDLMFMKDKYEQSQNQSNIQELKRKTHFLEDYVHRLNAASSEYQAMHPPKTLKKEMNKDQRKTQGLPSKGPSPIWLLNQKFLAPLFVCYDEKLHENKEFIKKLQAELNELHDQVKMIANENILLNERLSRSTTSKSHDAHLSDIEHIKRQAYLVLEENKVLQEQLNLQTNRLTDVQKVQIQEVSHLTRRLMIVENEKTENDRILETIRMRNEDLKRKNDHLVMDSNHRIHVQEHVHEISEMKRLTDELSEKHAHEMELVLRRVQDAESAKKIAQLKLTENRSEMERLKGEIKAIKKSNHKLQLRVQTYEKKLELQQVKEHRVIAMLEKSSDELEQTKLERDTYLALAKTKEEEMNKTQVRLIHDADKLAELEERLETYKSKNKERAHEAQEQIKKQHDNLKLRCLEHEQRIQQLVTLLNEKQVLVDDLNAEKRHLEVDLEAIWQATNADSMRIREQLLDMRVVS
ncbi:unnamed protein product [Rotaria magnacalcarata]|uniref:Centrosomal protein of 89 kDa n=2 Tax=Rotaria magnacalcarata TaxID=392030 RepID=A0A815F2Z7_9BILA|nr:unnamed protein product [Rotaria magnacalcarata]CAF1514189.1 unnamed protein product [Rotaria magnacalcarata]CAF2084949.1 unnamed protein product [Rotaria magnacalcarata]CAF3807066.1 unnamed protein product [Rotaria magnacalcarata]CAF3832362.1 unnamed protein product [Rotaria magnacalcarata]